MSRCYPYPPPGYEKKATTELIADIVPAAQVSSKEKHKHRDKEKKKRKRDDKDEKNSSHKEKRSSKNQKASATTPAHTNNDVGENGRLLQESSPSKSSTGSGLAIKDPKDAAIGVGGAAVQDAARRIPDRDSGWQEAKASETGKVGVSESRGGSHRSSDRSQAAPAAPAAAAGGNSSSSAAVASTSKYVVSDKEINGKVPVVAVKPLDTGQQAESQQRHLQQQQQQQQQQLEQQQKQQLQQQQQQLEQQQKLQVQQQQLEQQQDRMKEEEKSKEEEKRREKERKRSPPSGEKERESKEKERENKERRHRFPEIKLAAIKEERLEEDEGYLEWLYHKRRRDPVDNRDDDDDDDDDKKRGSFEQEVWAEAMFLPSVNMYALPYVVPN